jgi:hypothetical protein
VYVFIYEYVHVNTYTCIYTNVYISTYTYVNIYIHLNIQVMGVQKKEDDHSSALEHQEVSPYLLHLIQVYICIYTYMYLNMYIYIHIYAHIYLFIYCSFSCCIDRFVCTFLPFVAFLFGWSIYYIWKIVFGFCCVILFK